LAIAAVLAVLAANGIAGVIILAAFALYSVGRYAGLHVGINTQSRRARRLHA
jgi:hypothetical protein